MGTGDIKYGDTFVFLQHMKTGLWLSYQTFETKKRGVGRVEEKKARKVFIIAPPPRSRDVQNRFFLFRFGFGSVCEKNIEFG